MSWDPGKPSQNENEWFARRDAEWLREQRAKLDAGELAMLAHEPERALLGLARELEKPII